jgi:hypothetical protein
MSGEAEVKHCLEAMAACTQDDIVHWNWSIELVNSQVGFRRKGVSVHYYHCCGSEIRYLYLFDPMIRKPGWVPKKSESRSGMNNPDHISASLASMCYST